MHLESQTTAGERASGMLRMLCAHRLQRPPLQPPQFLPSPECTKTAHQNIQRQSVSQQKKNLGPSQHSTKFYTINLAHVMWVCPNPGLGRDLSPQGLVRAGGARQLIKRSCKGYGKGLGLPGSIYPIFMCIE